MKRGRTLAPQTQEAYACGMKFAFFATFTAFVCLAADPDKPMFWSAAQNKDFDKKATAKLNDERHLGTDAGVSAKYSYGFAEHHEIGMYVKLGMTTAEAIVASTSRPTEVLRIGDTGTLAKGKRADFIVLAANPLENIRNTREIDSVYLYGARLDRAALQAKFKQAVVDRDATKAKATNDYIPHPPSSRKAGE